MSSFSTSDIPNGSRCCRYAGCTRHPGFKELMVTVLGGILSPVQRAADHDQGQKGPDSKCGQQQHGQLFPPGAIG